MCADSSSNTKTDNNVKQKNFFVKVPKSSQRSLQNVPKKSPKKSQRSPQKVPKKSKRSPQEVMPRGQHTYNIQTNRHCNYQTTRLVSDNSCCCILCCGPVCHGCFCCLHSLTRKKNMKTHPKKRASQFCNFRNIVFGQKSSLCTF